ncbi:MAG: LTA synthase family protein, partial [Burkholderiaceae bacterium]|nr:LTA synthase family protein [Burkholderiaceae bacterium]
DLTIYLRHLRNADRMIGALRHSLGCSRRPASLCWFGDHVPSMPGVYDALGAPVGLTGFALWSTRENHHTEPVPLAVHQLAVEWLRGVGLMGEISA